MQRHLTAMRHRSSRRQVLCLQAVYAFQNRKVHCFIDLSPMVSVWKCYLYGGGTGAGEIVCKWPAYLKESQMDQEKERIVECAVLTGVGLLALAAILVFLPDASAQSVYQSVSARPSVVAGSTSSAEHS